MEKTFQTGSFSFRLKFPEELVLPVDMEKFLVETDSVDYTYIITAVDILPEAEGELIVDRVDLQVFHTKEGLESRRIGVKGEARPYAFSVRLRKIVRRFSSAGGIWQKLKSMKLFFFPSLPWSAVWQSSRA